MAKALLSSWSCEPRTEPSTLFLHLRTDGGSMPCASHLRFISIAGDYGQALLAPNLLPEIVPLLECPSCRIVGYDMLFDLGVIRNAIGRRLQLPNLWDTRLASQLLDNGLSFKELSLQSICRDLLGWHFGDSPEASGKAPDKGSNPSAIEMDYASRVCAVLESIQAKQMSLIRMNRLENVAKIEFQALPALAEIEYSGIGFDEEKGKRLLESLIYEKDRLERELEQYANREKIRGFNPRNPVHVKKLLQRRGYDLQSTSAADLERILSTNPKEPFIKSILKYRELRQQIGFLKNWTEYSREDRIYPRLTQLGGRSGRITCSRPNIQQVPRDPLLKRLFVASHGMVFVEADFSAIEMRIIAVLSGDKAMQKIFKSGLDPHRQTAQAIFQKKKISDEERQIAKTLNYGTIYGGGTNMILSNLPGLTEGQAREFLHRFYDAYPELEIWQRMVTDGARLVEIKGKAYKISRSALGRIRHIDPRHRNALINTPVQATGADLQKIALGRIYEQIALPQYSDFRLINAVHDSILLEVPDKRKREASRLLSSVMEEAGNEILKVIPCLTDVKVGKDWSFDKDGGVLSGFISRMLRFFLF